MANNLLRRIGAPFLLAALLCGSLFAQYVPVVGEDGRVENPRRYESVPPEAQSPVGPYHQAPAEYGGEWWILSPFTGPEPWTRLKRESPIDPGFLKAFGPRPEQSRGMSGDEIRSVKRARSDWQSHQDRFGGLVDIVAEGYATADEARALSSTFEFWDSGEPVFFRYLGEFRVRVVGAPVGWWQDAESLIVYPHLTIAGMQNKMLLNGIIPAKKHPYTSNDLYRDVLAAKDEQDE